jgi:hypothetical protein
MSRHPPSLIVGQRHPLREVAEGPFDDKTTAEMSKKKLDLLRGLLALASLNRACRDHRPGVSATLTTTDLDRSSLRWLGIDP